MKPGRAILQNGRDWPDAHWPDAPWLLFEHPHAIIQTRQADGVATALEAVRQATDRGAWAAGFVAYEAAAGLDPAFRVHPGATRQPLVWFGLYDAPQAVQAPPPADAESYRLGPWTAELGPEAYTRKIERIREWIAAGDTYQVNFTYPLRSELEGEPEALWAALTHAQPTRYGALIEWEGGALVSVSPELFFAQAGDRVRTRPMKGTAPRGRWSGEDARCAAALAASVKDRAENVMIVDLLRNDLGRLARPGSVHVEHLFEIERYPTVLQMTSTIAAQTGAHPIETLAALFPCGSVTGAPKIRTMALIAQLESAPRGIYTGAIGWIAPQRRAQFNVAIRTVELEAPAETGGRAAARYGIGGGITWGSAAGAEYAETQTKAALLTRPRPDFALFETLLWTPQGGYFLLDRHQARLMDSAGYFGFTIDCRAIEVRLADSADTFGTQPHRVRLLADRTSRIEIEAAPLAAHSGTPPAIAPPPATGAATRRVGWADEPVDESDPFLFHKTTQRAVYERARAARPGLDDVLLHNRQGQLTECCIGNAVVEWEGGLWTPPRECGLLAGTLRGALLDAGVIRERVLPRRVLAQAQAVWLINSVRGWQRAQLDET